MNRATSGRGFAAVLAAGTLRKEGCWAGESTAVGRSTGTTHQRRRLFPGRRLFQRLLAEVLTLREPCEAISDFNGRLPKTGEHR
jgi:hypothetical protein